MQQEQKKPEELKEKVRTEATPQSKWDKAVRGYALEMLNNIKDTTRPADSLNLGELVNHCGYTPVKIGTFSAHLGKTTPTSLDPCGVGKPQH